MGQIWLPSDQTNEIANALAVEGGAFILSKGTERCQGYRLENLWMINW
jgi:hypothetical protein